MKRRPRFKIDAYDSSSWPFALYLYVGWWRGWIVLKSFDTREAAREHHAKLRDLPEYLE